jgi:molybdenum cofactor cytidylyltransferase
VHNANFRWIAVVLAAGASARMGRPKQLIEVGGETLIRKAIRCSQKAGADEIVVVLGYNHEEIKKEIEGMPIHITIHEHAEKGMGSSIKHGVNFVLNNYSEVNALMILVCDQPLLTLIHLKKIIEEFKHSKSPIVASAYSNRKGVPVLFHRSMFDQLLQLDDEHGAKKMIEQNSALVKAVDFPDGSIDLDTPEDVRNLKL